MLYTEDFTMRHYVGFSQIGSHICQQVLFSCNYTVLLDVHFVQVLLEL